MTRSVPQTSYAAVSGAGYDRCFTPWHGVAPLLPYLRPHSRIWECCAGDGWMARWLREAGHMVIESDYVTGQDALVWAPDPNDYDVVITNPPWSLKYKFLERLYTLGKPWAMLLPYSTPFAATAKKIRDKHQASWEEMRLDKRINYSMPSSGFNNAGAQLMSIWMCHHILPASMIEATLPDPRPEHRLTKPPKKRQLTRDDVVRWIIGRNEGFTIDSIANMIVAALEDGIPIAP